MTSPEYQPYAPQEQPATPYIPAQPAPPAADQFPTRVEPSYGSPEPSAPPAYSAPEQPAYHAPAYSAPEQPTYGAPAYSAPAQPAYGAPEQPAYNAPAQPTYGAPAQPAYGAPAQPNYGAPAQPAYGAPAQPAYGAPAQPAYAQPGYPAPDYAAQVSAPAGYPSVSAVPASAFPASGTPASAGGYPVVYPPVAPAAAKGGKGGLFITVTIVAVVCLVASAVLTVMFLNKSSDYDRANKLASDRAAVITTDEATIASDRDKLTAANAASAKLQSDLDDKTNQLTETTHEKAVIAKCVNDMNKFFDAASRNASNSTLDKLWTTSQKSCHDADKYLS